MNKTLTPAEVSELLQTVAPPIQMDRATKLQHWATLVRDHRRQLDMFHGIEYIPAWEYNNIRMAGETIFDVAAADPAFQAQGLGSNNLGENVRFFELHPNELHFVSCDCHGVVRNEEVANRIAHISSGARFGVVYIT